MSRTVEYTIYKYMELSDKAKEKARDWFSQTVFDYDWWDFTYEDAARVGLKITEFGLDRSKHAKGELTGTVGESVRAILKEHGKTCDTYKLALNYYRARHDRKHPGMFTRYSSRLCKYTVEEFTKDLLEEYASILQDEADYMQSTEYLEEGIIANEYEFEEDGSRA